MVQTPSMSVPDNRAFIVAVGGLAALALPVLLLVPAIPQDPAYHRFADTRSLLGIAHFWNVFTNVLFALAGVHGLATRHRVDASVRQLHYRVLCVAAILVAFGSTYYHLSPDTWTLVWDRLPITVAFMALFTMVVSDRFSPRLAARLFWPLIAAGLASVVYWYLSELWGKGDLRPYGLVQLGPLALIPVLLLVHPGRGMQARWMWLALLAYLLAKAAEHFDVAIMHLLQGFSGHSLKHVLAAFGVWFAILAMRRSDGELALVDVPSPAEQLTAQSS